MPELWYNEAMFLRWQDRLRRHITTFIKPHKHSTAQRFILPFVLVAGVVAGKLFLRTFVSEQTSYHLLMLIIILSAFYGGFRSGLFATVLAAGSEVIFFMPPNESYFGVYTILSTLFLVIGGIYISVLSDLKHTAELKKDGFIGIASHELKSPLASIQGYAQKLLKQGEKLTEKESTETVRSILKQAKKSTHIIDELLDITKIEAGKMYFVMKRFPLFEAVEETVKAQRVVYKSFAIRLEGKTTKKIYADRYRIEQALINLIDNAVKYSGEKKEVIVMVRNIHKEVVISVTDFGKGIPARNLGKIFDPYYRDDVISGDVVPGLGLGLSITQEIARHHRGRVWVESSDGKGATFSIALPIE